MSWVPNKWTLTCGQPAKFPVHLLKEDGTPAQISGATEVRIRITKADKTILEKNAVDGYANGQPMNTLWIYGFSFTAEEVDSLPMTPDQSVEILVFFGSVVQFLYYPKALSIVHPKI